MIQEENKSGASVYRAHLIDHLQIFPGTNLMGICDNGIECDADDQPASWLRRRVEIYESHQYLKVNNRKTKLKKV